MHERPFINEAPRGALPLLPTSPADPRVLGTCMAKHDPLWGLGNAANLKLQ